MQMEFTGCTEALSMCTMFTFDSKSKTYYSILAPGNFLVRDLTNPTFRMFVSTYLSNSCSAGPDASGICTSAEVQAAGPG